MTEIEKIDKQQEEPKIEPHPEFEVKQKEEPKVPKEKSKRGSKGAESLKKWREKRKAEKQEHDSLPFKEKSNVKKELQPQMIYSTVESKKSKPQKIKPKQRDNTMIILGIMALIITLGLGAFFLIPSFKNLVMSKIKLKENGKK